MGSLTLETDAMVTGANSHNVLIGNDWLQMAGADILLSSGVIWLRIDRQQYEDVPIEANTGFPYINMMQKIGTEEQKVFARKAYLTQFLEKHGIDPKEWDTYASRYQQMPEETSPEDSAFQDLSSIESLPLLDEEADSESLDGIREDQPEEAEPFDQALVSILQKDRPECSIQRVLELPMPSSFLVDGPEASSEEFP